MGGKVQHRGHELMRDATQFAWYNARVSSNMMCQFERSSDSHEEHHTCLMTMDACARGYALHDAFLLLLEALT